MNGETEGNPMASEKNQDILLEQWKTCVEAADGISEKRNNANGLFITINTALCAVITFTLENKSMFLAIIGIIICLLWRATIKSYKELNAVKYEIINSMEAYLPISPYSIEWKKLKENSKHKELTTIEKCIPWIFIAIYAISILYPVIEKIIEKLS